MIDDRGFESSVGCAADRVARAPLQDRRVPGCQDGPVPVDEVAQRGFGSAADAYERSRPSYPTAAVEWLVEHLRLGPDSRVVDLGAGTGKLTRLLVPTGASVLAVEPVEGMWRALGSALPTVLLLAGVAEALPLPSSSVDAVAIAQALHWFDADATWTELARVLCSGGRVGLVWNTRERCVDWLDALWAIIDRVESNDRWTRHGSWLDAPAETRRCFSPMQHATFAHEQRLDHDGVIRRVEGVSYVAALPENERAAVIDEVRALLATHAQTSERPELTLPYRTDVSWCERT